MSNEIKITERLSYLTERINMFFANYQLVFERENTEGLDFIEFKLYNSVYKIFESLECFNEAANTNHQGIKIVNYENFNDILMNQFERIQRFIADLQKEFDLS